MIQVNSLDILLLVRSVRPRCVIMSTFSYLSKTKKSQIILSKPPYIRIGRCVMKPYLNSTFPIVMEERLDMLRTMLIAILAFLRFITIANSDHSDSLRNRQLSDIVRMTRRKLKKATLKEMVLMCEKSAMQSKIIYFAIPRSISVVYSRNAIDLANYLLLDYCMFMGTYTEQLKELDSPIYYYLHSYLRSVMLQTGLQ